MSRRVVILPRAERDADRIALWIGERSAAGARRWSGAFRAATRRLRRAPEQFGPAPESEFVPYDLRQFPFGTPHGHVYRGLFVVVGDEVRVLRLRGPGQPPLTEDDLGQ